jgi:hypothetical protein
MPGRAEKLIQNFSWKPEGRRPLGRPIRGWEGNVKMNLNKLCLLDLSCSGSDQVAAPCERSNEPFSSIKDREFLC